MRNLIFLYFLISTCSLSGQITKFPLLAYSSAEDIRIIEITNVQKDHLGRHITLVKMEYTPRQSERFMIPPGMYINDPSNSEKRYELIGFTEDSHYIGKWYAVEKGERQTFTIIFEGLDPCVNVINIYEPQIPNTVTWEWKDIMLNNYCKGKLISPLAQNFNAMEVTTPNTQLPEPTSPPTVKKQKERKVIGW